MTLAGLVAGLALVVFIVVLLLEAFDSPQQGDDVLPFHVIVKRSVTALIASIRRIVTKFRRKS